MAAAAEVARQPEFIAAWPWAEMARRHAALWHGLWRFAVAALVGLSLFGLGLWLATDRTDDPAGALRQQELRERSLDSQCDDEGYVPSWC